MADLPLSMAVWTSDRTRAIEDGRVRIPGCDLTVHSLTPTEMFQRALRDQEFDVTELSISNYLTLLSRNDCPYLAIPVFPARRFRHSCLYIRTDRGIDSPAALRGRTIGINDYAITAAVWLRGVLDDDYGVTPESVRWSIAGLDRPGKRKIIDFVPPPGVRIEQGGDGKTLSGMLASGEIDAVLSPQPPRCYLEGAAPVRRLFEDYAPVERDYFRRTGVFPIMHCVALRRRLLEQHPELAASVYAAFDESKTIALALLREGNPCRVALPWLQAIVDDLRGLMGDDYWPYGIDANLPSLRALLRYHRRQGLAARDVSLGEMFAPMITAVSESA